MEEGWAVESLKAETEKPTEEGLEAEG